MYVLNLSGVFTPLDIVVVPSTSADYCCICASGEEERVDGYVWPYWGLWGRFGRVSDDGAIEFYSTFDMDTAHVTCLILHLFQAMCSGKSEARVSFVDQITAPLPIRLSEFTTAQLRTIEVLLDTDLYTSLSAVPSYPLFILANLPINQHVFSIAEGSPNMKPFDEPRRLSCCVCAQNECQWNDPDFPKELPRNAFVVSEDGSIGDIPGPPGGPVVQEKRGVHLLCFFHLELDSQYSSEITLINNTTLRTVEGNDLFWTDYIISGMNDAGKEVACERLIDRYVRAKADLSVHANVPTTFEVIFSWFDLFVPFTTPYLVSPTLPNGDCTLCGDPLPCFNWFEGYGCSRLDSVTADCIDGPAHLWCLCNVPAFIDAIGTEKWAQIVFDSGAFVDSALLTPFLLELRPPPLLPGISQALIPVPVQNRVTSLLKATAIHIQLTCMLCRQFINPLSSAMVHFCEKNPDGTFTPLPLAEGDNGRLLMHEHCAYERFHRHPPTSPWCIAGFSDDVQPTSPS